MEKILTYFGRAFLYLANAIHNAKIDAESYLFELIFIDDHLTKTKLVSHVLPTSSKPSRRDV
jgi:hypothetical protein